MEILTQMVSELLKQSIIADSKAQVALKLSIEKFYENKGLSKEEIDEQIEKELKEARKKTATSLIEAFKKHIPDLEINLE